MSQPTGIVNESRLLAWAGEFYFGTSLASLTRIGAYRDATIESKRESSELVFDNDKINKFKKGREFSFKFKLAEIDPDTIASLNSGWISKTVVAGTLLSGQTQAISGVAALQLVEFAGQNHDLALITVASVSGSVDGSLVANTDYALVKGPNGKTNIYFKSGGAITTFTQTFTVTYSYTPAASVKLSFVDTGIATKFYAKFIHERADGKQIIIDLEDVQNLTGLTIDFVGNSDDDVATCDIELNGKVVPNGLTYEV